MISRGSVNATTTMTAAAAAAASPLFSPRATKQKKQSNNNNNNNNNNVRTSLSLVLLFFFVGGILIAGTLHVNMIRLQQQRRQEQQMMSSSNHINSINKDKRTTISRIVDIVEKYGFVDPDAAARVLQLIDEKYDNERPIIVDKGNGNNGKEDPDDDPFANDVLFFYHPPKTGGTSVSNLLKTLYGQDGIVPASAPSGWFHRQLLQKQIVDDVTQQQQQQQQQGGGQRSPTHSNNDNNKNDENDEISLAARLAWWGPRKVLYTHSHLTEVDDGKGGENLPLYDFLEREMGGQQQPQRKQLKLMTMLREPTDRIASAFNDHICEIGGRLRHIRRKIQQDQGPCLGLDHRNLTMMADTWLDDHFKPKCRDDPKSLKGSFEYPLCQKIRRQFKQNSSPITVDAKSFFANLEDPRPHCRSIAAFLNSSRYQEEHHFFLENVLPSARKTKAGMDGGAMYAQPSAIADIEQEALRQLGGLAGAMGHANAPMVWFGLTERMEESICLLHYTLKRPYEVKTPTNRVQACRPTNWFQDSHHRSLILQQEGPEYAIHRAASAIMDVRLAHMCHDIKNNVSNGLPELCCFDAE